MIGKKKLFGFEVGIVVKCLRKFGHVKTAKAGSRIPAFACCKRRGTLIRDTINDIVKPARIVAGSHVQQGSREG